MFFNESVTLFVLLLPILAATGGLLLAQVSVSGARTQASTALFSVALLSAFLMLIVLRTEYVVTLTASQLMLSTLAMLGAMIAALPLLDRARLFGLGIATTLAGAGAVHVTLFYFEPALPLVAPHALLYVVVLAMLVMGSTGSLILPLHPLRHDSSGAARWQPIPQGPVLTGWLLIAVVLSGFCWLMEAGALPVSQLPMLAAALVAAWFALMHARQSPAQNALQKAGEGLAAGVLLTALAPMDIHTGAALGLLAGMFVNRSEAIAQALRIDDPAHLIGAMWLPALLGMLMPGLLDLELLARHIQWLGAALALGLALAAIAWPLTMLTFGFALPARLVKQPQK